MAEQYVKQKLLRDAHTVALYIVFDTFAIVATSANAILQLDISTLLGQDYHCKVACSVIDVCQKSPSTL